MSEGLTFHPYVDRLHKIVRFWQATHEIKSIHMSRQMHQELAADITGHYGRANALDEFMGIPIRYCDVEGCGDGPNEACFSIFTGMPLATVRTYDPNKVWSEPETETETPLTFAVGTDFGFPNADQSVLVVKDKAGKALSEGAALLMLGTITMAQFRQEYTAEWVSSYDGHTMAHAMGGAFSKGETLTDQELLREYWAEQSKDSGPPPEGLIWE